MQSAPGVNRAFEKNKKAKDKWRVQMQKLLSAIWNVLLKLAFLSGPYIYVQLFHFNCIEKDLYIAIKMTEPKHSSLIKMFI